MSFISNINCNQYSRYVHLPQSGRSDLDTTSEKAEAVYHRVHLEGSMEIPWAAVMWLIIKDQDTLPLKQGDFTNKLFNRNQTINGRLQELPDIINQLSSVPVARVLRDITLENVRSPFVIAFLRKLDSKYNMKILNTIIISLFLNQKSCENLFDYLKYVRYKQSFEINVKFFESLNVKIQNVFARYSKCYSPYFRDLK